MSLFVGIDPGKDNLGLAFLQNDVVEMHKMAPFTIKTKNGYKSVSFEERFALDFAIGLAKRYKKRFEQAAMIGVEQQMKSQSMIVVSVALWSVLRAMFPQTPVVKVRPHDWHEHLHLTHGDYGTRKAMSADYVESMVPIDEWDEMQRSFQLPKNRKKNVDAFEATLIAMYLRDNYGAIMDRNSKSPRVNRKKLKRAVEPDVVFVTKLDFAKAKVPAPRTKTLRAKRDPSAKRKKKLTTPKTKRTLKKKNEQIKIKKQKQKQPSVIDLTVP